MANGDQSLDVGTRLKINPFKPIQTVQQIIEDPVGTTVEFFEESVSDPTFLATGGIVDTDIDIIEELTGQPVESFVSQPLSEIFGSPDDGLPFNLGKTSFTELQRLQADAIRKRRQKLQATLRRRLEEEEAAIGEVVGTREGREKAIGEALKQQLGGVEAEAERFREAVADEFAARGLGRSTFAKRGFEQAELARLGKRTEAIGQAQEQIQAGRTAEKRLRSDIERRKEQLEIDIESGELEALTRERDFLRKTAAEQAFAAQIAQIEMESARKQQMTGLFGSLATAGALILACWVARSIFGTRSNEWLFARKYILEDSPMWFVKLYLKYGERFALFLDKYPMFKPIIRPFFEYFAFKGKTKWLQNQPA